MVYNIRGKIKKGNGNNYTSVTVTVLNNTTSESDIDTTDGHGAYSIDISTFLSGYTNGDSITVRCNSIDKNLTINETVYPGEQTVNLIAYVKFIVNGNTINNVKNVIVKKSIGQSVWEAKVALENKSGRRSQTYTAFQTIELYIDGTTIMKGRIRDIDIQTNHILTLICENQTAYLFDRYTNDEQYLSKSIYYAITDTFNGLIPKYLPGLTTTNVANDANTQQIFTKTFNKESIGNALEWLGDLASSIGYDFYVDNDKDLHFVERRATDSNVNLSNIGSDRNVIKWDWKESSGRDIYNRIVVFGNSFDTTRNDLTSQGTYGIREAPPITDTSLLTTAQANSVGDNKIARYANPYKEASVIVMLNSPVITSGFGYIFPMSFDLTTTANVIDVEPGDIVYTRLSGSGINDDIPESRVVSDVEFNFPKYKAKFDLSEYKGTLGSIIADTVRKGYQ